MATAFYSSVVCVAGGTVGSMSSMSYRVDNDHRNAKSVVASAVVFPLSNFVLCGGLMRDRTMPFAMRNSLRISVALSAMQLVMLVGSVVV